MQNANRRERRTGLFALSSMHVTPVHVFEPDDIEVADTVTVVWEIE